MTTKKHEIVINVYNILGSDDRETLIFKVSGQKKKSVYVKWQMLEDFTIDDMYFDSKFVRWIAFNGEIVERPNCF